MLTRSIPWLLVTALGLGCDGGASLSMVATTTQATSEGSKDDSGQTDTSTLLITGAVVLGLSVSGTVVALTEDGSGDFSYLERHQQEVRVALARGDGPFMADLGRGLALPPGLVPHLATVVRRARPELEPPLASGRVDRARARAFSRALVAALDADALLSPYLDRALIVASAASAR